MPDLDVRMNERYVAQARVISRAASGAVIAIGLVVLAGWVVDAAIVKGIYAGITMKANTALAFALSGVSLWLVHSPRSSVRARVGFGCGALAGCIGAATLSQHLFGWDLGIDQLLFTELPGAAATTSPGRMGPPAATSFALAGIALVLMHRRRAAYGAQGAAVAIGLAALLAITGYAYDVQTLYGIAPYSGIALHTAIALFILSVGMLTAFADRGIAALFVGDGAGSVMARRLLPVAILIPMLLGWIRIRLEMAGQLDHRFGVAVLVLAIIVVLTAYVVHTAVRLNQVERQQLATEAALRDRLSDIETMMEVLPIGVFITTDPSAEHIMANRAAREFLRIPESHANTSLSAPPDEAPSHFRVFQNGVEVPPADLPVQRAAREGVATHDVVLDIVFSDGTVKNELLSALPLLDAQGRPRGAVASLMDITARRAAEREREELLARAQQARELAEAANRAKDEFLATMSHELRTPLVAILGWAAMLRDGVASDEKTRATALESIERNAKAQSQLVEDLLDVARIASGKLRLDVAPLDLVPVVTAAVDVVHPAADAKGIVVRTALDQPCCQVRGDGTRLQQVVWNLLTNAVKFTGRGGAVDVRLGTSSGEAMITVSDTGEGIDPEFLPHVFDRFSQAESRKTRRHGGLGLGLSIARHIVEMHGGTIEAMSAGPGRGATFTVRLPLFVPDYTALTVTTTPTAASVPVA